MSNANREREIQRIEDAIRSAAKSHFEEGSRVDVHINHESGEPRVSVNGRHLTKDEIGELVGWVAAQRATEVIIQKIREAENGTSEDHPDES
jgi:hypothetical protein